MTDRLHPPACPPSRSLSDLRYEVRCKELVDQYALLADRYEGRCEEAEEGRRECARLAQAADENELLAGAYIRVCACVRAPCRCIQTGVCMRACSLQLHTYGCVQACASVLRSRAYIRLCAGVCVDEIGVPAGPCGC